MQIHIVIGEEIAHAKADVIVNAANGCGWMGGIITKHILSSGVAEHLNYYTHGSIEKDAKRKARRFRCISAFLFGTAPGNIFSTANGGLECKEIIHAVTMRYPGLWSSYQSVRSCMEKILSYCEKQGYTSIAIPLLGCGTGRLKPQKVLDIMKEFADGYDSVDLYVYSLKETSGNKK